MISCGAMAEHTGTMMGIRIPKVPQAVPMEKDKNAEIADFFRREGLSPNVRFTTWDDYAILSIVESGLGVSLLPRLILKRIPYQVAAKETAPSFHRDIVLALRDRKTAPLAVRRFLEYLPYR